LSPLRRVIVNSDRSSFDSNFSANDGTGLRLSLSHSTKLAVANACMTPRSPTSNCPRFRVPPYKAVPPNDGAIAGLAGRRFASSGSVPSFTSLVSMGASLRLVFVPAAPAVPAGESKVQPARVTSATPAIIPAPS
jgi:hypothetical protein